MSPASDTMLPPKRGCPRTDQESCFDAAGEPIPCPGTGQDGDTRTGSAWPDPRFAATDTRVRDLLTGLVWMRCAAPAEFPMTWEEAHGFIDQLNRSGAGGCRNWRLPGRRELFSLLSHSRINPALPEGHPFTDVFDGYYWTATPCAGWPRQAWYIHLGGARVFKGMRHGSYMVWPVCGDRPNASPGPPAGSNGQADRFFSRGSGITDRRSGLTWHRNADLADAPLAWTDALEAVRRLNDAEEGFGTPWRLPNIRELESLADTARHSPAIAGHHLFDNIRDFYWSATTSVYDPAYAWTLYTRDGNIGVGFKRNAEFHLWPVRNAGSRAIATQTASASPQDRNRP